MRYIRHIKRHSERKRILSQCAQNSMTPEAISTKYKKSTDLP